MTTRRKSKRIGAPPWELNGQRRILTMSTDEFYALALMMCGQPWEVRQINVMAPAQTQASRAIRGPIHPYRWFFSEHPHGKAFTQCVINAGEGSTRAARIYSYYRRWYWRTYPPSLPTKEKPFG